MPVYFIAQVDIHDQAGYDSYAQQAGASFAGLDAKVLAADDTPEVVAWMGEVSRDNDVNVTFGLAQSTRRPDLYLKVIEFADEAEFHKWYDSPEYQQAAKTRWAATDSNAALVKGLG